MGKKLKKLDDDNGPDKTPTRLGFIPTTLTSIHTGDQVYNRVFQFSSKLHLLLTSSAHSDMWSSDGMYKVATFDVGVMCSTHCVPDLALSYSIVSLV